MTEGLSGATNPGIKKRRISGRLLILVLVILLVAAGAFKYWHDRSNSPNKIVSTDYVLSNDDQVKSLTKHADEALSQKNYDDAVQSYVGAASAAFASTDYQKSADILQRCISEIPDSNVPWYVYSSLAVSAKQIKDINLEKSSLQKGIQKAQRPNSEASAGNIATMQKELDGIK